MIIHEINANNMRLLSTKNVEINDILIQINDRAKDGYTNIYLDDTTIKDSTKKELERRGFKVETGGRYNEVNTNIRW